MLELNGYETKTIYYINPSAVSGFHKHECDGSLVFTNRVVDGTTLRYHVKETCEEIKDQIDTIRAFYGN